MYLNIYVVSMYYAGGYDGRFQQFLLLYKNNPQKRISLFVLNFEEKGISKWRIPTEINGDQRRPTETNGDLSKSLCYLEIL